MRHLCPPAGGGSEQVESHDLRRLATLEIRTEIREDQGSPVRADTPPTRRHEIDRKRERSARVKLALVWHGNDEWYLAHGSEPTESCAVGVDVEPALIRGLRH